MEKTGFKDENRLPADKIELSQEQCDKVEKNPQLLKEVIDKLPGVDIHRHLEGAIKPKTALRIAEKYGIELPAKTEEGITPYFCVTDKDKTLLDFLGKFKTIAKLWVSTDAIKEISTQCVLDAKDENIKAMELRFAPTSMAVEKNIPLKDVMDAVIEGVKEGEKQTGITVGLTLIIPRHKGVELGNELEQLTERYVKDGKVKFEEETSKPAGGQKKGFGYVTSIDLACDEANFPPDPYAPIFIESENDGIHRTLHAGEARGADSVRSALDKCHAERIGHGVRSFKRS